MSKWSTRNIPTKDNILRRFREIDIFNFYMNSSLAENSFFCNPMRRDKNPTCSFYRGSDGRLRMMDHAGYFHGDCFDLVQTILHCDYGTALRRIWEDLGGRRTAPKLIPSDFTYDYQPKKKKRIQVKIRPWGVDELRYWQQFGISQTTLEFFQVYPLEVVWIGETTYKQNEVARWKSNDPVYGYHFGDGEWKIYFPRRKRMRFLGNSGAIQGLNQLRDSDYLIITKSLKDVMVLYEYGLPSVAPQTEHMVLKELDDMLLYYQAVFVLFDNDVPGKRGAVKYRREGCIPLMVPNQKDISDHRLKFGHEKTQILIDETKAIFGFGD